MRSRFWLFLFVVFALSCNKAQDTKAALGAEVNGDSTGLRVISVDSQMTIFGSTRGVFTANGGAICVDRLGPQDVWPLIQRLKDPNSPMPQGMPVDAPSSKIPEINGDKNVNINVQVDNAQH